MRIQQSAQHRDQHHSRQFQIKPQDQDGRHRDANAESDRFTGGSGRLNDVVLKDRRVAQTQLGKHTKHRDGNDGHGD